MTPKAWAGVYLAVFLLVEGVLLLAFAGAGGDSRERGAMLADARRLLDAGRPEAGLEVLADFGERWPGALDTENFNLWLAQFHAAAGDPAAAARHYLRAVQAAPETKGTRALAARALHDAGDLDRAAELAAAELAEGDRLNDTADYLLGVAALEDDNALQAAEHFQAIADKDEFGAELHEVRERLMNETVAPAREMARSRAAELIERTTSDQDAS